MWTMSTQVSEDLVAWWDYDRGRRLWVRPDGGRFLHVSWRGRLQSAVLDVVLAHGGRGLGAPTQRPLRVSFVVLGPGGRLHEQAETFDVVSTAGSSIRALHEGDQSGVEPGAWVRVASGCDTNDVIAAAQTARLHLHVARKRSP